MHTDDRQLPTGSPRQANYSAAPSGAVHVREIGDPSHLYMDGLRALLAITVVFGHAWILIIEDYAPTSSLLVQSLYGLAGFAHAAVILFFVLSGYWITRSVVRRVDVGWSWRTYLVDRSARLAVVLVPALVLGGILDAVGVWIVESPTHLGRTGSWVLRKNVEADLSIATLLSNLLFLQSIVAQPFGTNGPLWSVAVEFWCYVWFPALWLLFRYRRPSWAVLTLVLAAAAPQLMSYFAIWLCGSGLFFLERKLVSDQNRGDAGRLTMMVAVAAFAAALAWNRSGTSFPADLVLAATFSAVLLALRVNRPAFPRRLAPLAGFGARASFSLYATHFPLVALLAGFVVGSRRLPPSPTNMAIVAGAVFGSLLAASLFARLTEAKTERVRVVAQRLLQPRWGKGDAIAKA